MLRLWRVLVGPGGRVRRGRILQGRVLRRRALQRGVSGVVRAGLLLRRVAWRLLPVVIAVVGAAVATVSGLGHRIH